MRCCGWCMLSTVTENVDFRARPRGGKRKKKKKEKEERGGGSLATWQEIEMERGILIGCGENREEKREKKKRKKEKKVIGCHVSIGDWPN